MFTAQAFLNSFNNRGVVTHATPSNVWKFEFNGTEEEFKTILLEVMNENQLVPQTNGNSDEEAWFPGSPDPEDNPAYYIWPIVDDGSTDGIAVSFIDREIHIC